MRGINIIMGNMLGIGIWQADLTASDYVRDGWEWVTALCVLSTLCLFLAVILCVIRRGTVRIYNWNGQKYCYLGRTGLRRSGGGYLVCIGERMADLSHTTLYQICPSKYFVRKNRYRDMVLRAGNASCLLHVDSCMRQSVYYRE